MHYYSNSSFTIKSLLKSCFLLLIIACTTNSAQDTSEPTTPEPTQPTITDMRTINAYQAMCLLAALQARIEPVVLDGVAAQDAPVYQYVLESIYELVEYCKTKKEDDTLAPEALELLVHTTLVVNKIVSRS